MAQHNSTARTAWTGSGIAFFTVGVVFTLTMPDNVALGIAFLALGVVFFSLSSTPGGGRGGGGGSGVGDGDGSGDGSGSGSGSGEGPQK